MIGQSGGLEPTRDSNPVGLEEHLCLFMARTLAHHTINTTTSNVWMVKNIHV